MELEKISDEEYLQYIERLKKKKILSMDWEEKTDLAAFLFDSACENENWKDLKTSLRLLLLAMQDTEQKADVTKMFLMKALKGEKIEEHGKREESCTAEQADTKGTT